MPSIPNPIVYFAWKFSGYSLAGVGLKRYYERPVNPLLFGTIRVISGLLVGAVAAPLLFIGNSEHTVIPVLWLIVVRVITWGLLVRFLYERDSENRVRLIVVSGFGLLFSFCLDGVFDLLTRLFPDLLSIPFC